MAFSTWREWYICAILLAGLAAGQTFPDLSECGKNAGCFRYPAGCTPAKNCTSVLRWRMSNESNYVSFDMLALSDGWVAVGFSMDSRMGDDSVVDCIRNNSNNDTVKVGLSFNGYQKNTPYISNSTTQYLKDANASYVDGFIFCQFQRMISGDNVDIYSLNNSYYLLLGYGPAVSGVKQQHRMFPEVSPMHVNVVTDLVDISNPNMNPTQPPTVPTTLDVYSCSQLMNCIADGKGSQVTFAAIPGTNQVLINMTSILNGTSGWFGVGFSNDTTMNDDSVIDCIRLENGTIIVKHSYNAFHNNTEIFPNATEGLANASLTYASGLLQCLFERQIDGLLNSQIFNLSKPYYLFLAQGPVTDTGMKRKHLQRFMTPYAITVTSNFSVPKVKSYFADGKGNYVAYKYLNDSDEMEFKMTGPVTEQGTWITLGFSNDTQMGSDSCLDCILLKNDTIVVQHSYNNESPKYNFALNSNEGITLIETNYQNGSLMCAFRRKVSSFADPRIFSLDKPYYLLLGKGLVDDNDNGRKQKHTETPVISTYPVDLRAVGNVTSGMETGTTTNSPASTGTSAPSNMSRFKDLVANNEVLFKLSEDGAHVNFTIRGPLKTDGWWIAVGFSDDNKMGNDSVMDCILLSNGTFRVQISYNPLNTGVKNEEVGNPDSAITDITATSDGSFMTCSFKRKISGFSDSRIFPLTQPYYLLLASGQLMANGKKSQHQNRVPSQSTFNLTASMGREEQGMTTPSNPLASTETQAPFSEVSRFSDPVANTEVQFKLSEDGTRVNFTIRGPRTRDGWWIGVGFSDDKIMGNDSVLDCILLSNGTFRVQISYNTLRSDVKNEEVGNPDSAMTDITATNDGSFMTCSLSRKISGFTDPRIFPFDKLYYLLLASGPVGDDGKKAQHLNRVPSSSTFNLTSLEGQNVSQDGRRHSNAPDPMRLLRAHGVLMITAFVMLLSGAIILARYYKTCWPENKICGTAVWFAAHRFLMVLGLFCCAAGFIIIFCYGDGFIYRSFSSGSPSYYWVHGPLGIVVMILIIINPIMAIFRCDPDHESRWIYNWMHFFVGMSCQILAGITLFFGIKMGELTYGLNHMAVFWLLIAFVGFHCFIEFILIIEKIVTQRHSNHSFTVNYGMTAPGEAPTAVKEGSGAPTRESLLFRYFVIALYALITMGLWLAMIILVGGSFHTT